MITEGIISILSRKLVITRLFEIPVKLPVSTLYFQIWRFGSKSDFVLSRESFPHPAAIPTQNPFTDFKLRITSSLQSSQTGRLVEEKLTNTVSHASETFLMNIYGFRLTKQ